MMLKPVSTPDAPAAIGPYSQAIVHGGLVWCSGQVAFDPATGQLIQGDVQDETRQVLKNLTAVLDAAGSGLHKVIRATVFLKDMNDFGAVNAVYAEAFGDHRPARACVEVARLPKDVRVEISVVAAV
jgi:2-iminobutanoate/2-iminopropanoate deaminase